MDNIPFINQDMESLEILLLDPSNLSSILAGNVFDPFDNLLNFPNLFVCRIYSNEYSLGTGFIYRTKNGRLCVISAKHISKSPFLSSANYFACFDLNQNLNDYINEFDKVANGTHLCQQNLFVINPIFFADDSVSQVDPITSACYSINNDICAFEIVNKCICGQINALLPFSFLEISSVPPHDSECFLFGFPGTLVSSERILPHAPELQSELANKINKMPSNILCYSMGHILKIGDLICVSTSSVSAMSGGPIIFFDQGV